MHLTDREYISGKEADFGQVGFSPSTITSSTQSVTLYLGGTGCSSTQEEDLLSTLQQEGIPAGIITITADGRIS